MTRLCLDLPEAPSANRYWRVFRGRAVKSAEARDYQAAVREHANAVVPVPGMFPFPKGTPVRVSVDWHRSIRSGDLDNRLKIVLDALKRVVYADDSQIVEIVARRFDAPRKGRVTVVVERAT